MKRKLKPKVIIILISLLLIAGIVFAVYKFGSKESKTTNNDIIGTIEGFGYTKNIRATEVFRNEFENLRKILTAKEIDYEAYAGSLSKLFIIDFYTLSNKLNRYDVGSLEYIDPRIVENFNLKALDTIYRFVENNTDNSRTLELPEVRSVQVNEIVETTFTIDGEELEAIRVTLSWEFVRLRI